MPLRTQSGCLGAIPSRGLLCTCFTCLLLNLLLSGCANQSSVEPGNSQSAEVEAADSVPTGVPQIHALDDGGTWTGALLNRGMHGNGYHDNGAGLTYDGEMVAGKRHGEGIEKRPDGSTYTGHWLDGKRSGSGRETAVDGSFHDGEWEFNQPRGPGSREFENGIQITGTFAGDIATTGLLVLPSGSTFAGPLWTLGGDMHPRFSKWVDFEASQGDPYAQLLYAQERLRSKTESESVLANEARLTAYLQAAESAGIGDAAYLYALHVLPTNREQALIVLRRAAARPHTPSARLLGELLLSDDPPRSCHPNNICRTEALELLQTAFKRGDRLAARRLTQELLRFDAAAARNVIHNFAMTFGDWQDLELLAAAHAALDQADEALQAATRALQQAERSDEAVSMDDLERLARNVETYQTKNHTEVAP
ncbi:MAG: hypothetical protein FJ194_00555 [Gammaproteobacteria bacterium]|nr:hypothetical protein [Gammaproteobacteria bacterium]